MFVREYGPAGAPSIVWLHGGGMGGWMWDRQISLFKDYHCLVPDLPGHGNSREAKFTMKGAAESVARLIREKARGGRAHVIGLSLGAQVLVELLGESPEVVDHAVINSALVRQLTYSKLMLNPVIIKLILKTSLPLAKNRTFARVQAGSYHLPEDMFETYYAETSQNTESEMVDVFRENAIFTIPVGLCKAKVPTLVVIGSKESILVDSAKDLVGTVPGARAFMVKNVGHTFVFENPGLYAHMIRSWISDQPLPEGELLKI